MLNFENGRKDTGYADEYAAARIGRVGANRMALGLPCIPHRDAGDALNYARLARLTLKVWEDLNRLRKAVHEDYSKVLQMTGKDRDEIMVLATRENQIMDVIEFGLSK